jgi:hypothetical protein
VPVDLRGQRLWGNEGNSLRLSLVGSKGFRPGGNHLVAWRLLQRDRPGCRAMRAVRAMVIAASQSVVLVLTSQTTTHVQGNGPEDFHRSHGF